MSAIRNTILWLSAVSVVAATLFGLDTVTAEYGERDHCDMLRLGQSKMLTDLRYDTYKHTHGAWHMECPCDSSVTYYLHYGRPLVLLRLDTLEIVCHLDDSDSSEYADACQLARRYGFDIADSLLSAPGDALVAIRAPSDKAHLRYQHREGKRDALNVFVWR